MERSGSTINDLFNKYDYLFDILGAQSECRKPDSKDQKEEELTIAIRSLQLMKFSLFPNPAKHSITLNFESAPGKIDIYINNTMGDLIYHEHIPEFDGHFDQFIDLSHNTNRLLILSIVQNEKMFAEQIFFEPN